MASRLCVFLVFLVSVKMIAAEPIFGKMWCDLMCDDDDDDDYSDDDDDYADIFGIFSCDGCPTSTTTKGKRTTLAPGTQPEISLMIAPASGVNVTMSNTGLSWLLNFMPWPFMSSATTAAPGPTTVAPTTAAAGNGTAGNSTAG